MHIEIIRAPTPTTPNLNPKPTTTHALTTNKKPSAHTSKTLQAPATTPQPLEPPATNPEPPASNLEPRASTLEPPTTTPEPPATTTKPPATTPEPPASTLEQPPATTPKPPATTPEPPATTQEPPATTTVCPFLLTVYNVGHSMSIMPDVTSLPVIGTACTATLDIDSGLGNLFWTPLVASTPNNYFAATWSSNFQVSTGGQYYFYIGFGNDDAFIISIDGTVLINAKVVLDVETYGYSDDHEGNYFKLSPGLHSVVLDYFHNEGTAGMSIQYSGPDTKYNLVDLQGEAPHPAFERERTLFFDTRARMSDGRRRSPTADRDGDVCTGE